MARPPSRGAAGGAEIEHASNGQDRFAGRGPSRTRAAPPGLEHRGAPEPQETSSDAVTVAEALRVVLPGSRVAGGESGLARRVTWATTLRSRPPAFEPRGGGEFVLAARETLDSLHQADHSLTLTRILEGLAQAGAAALACAGPIADDAAATADALQLPLVEIPSGGAL